MSLLLEAIFSNSVPKSICLKTWIHLEAKTRLETGLNAFRNGDIQILTHSFSGVNHPWEHDKKLYREVLFSQDVLTHVVVITVRQENWQNWSTSSAFFRSSEGAFSRKSITIYEQSDRFKPDKFSNLPKRSRYQRSHLLILSLSYSENSGLTYFIRTVRKTFLLLIH